MTKKETIGKLKIELESEREKNKILLRELNYYKKLYNESFNLIDEEFTGEHIPRID